MKTITSERTIKSKDFKIKIGTLNKKTPLTMYLEAGTYIRSTDDDDNYKSKIYNIEKEMKLLTKQLIRSVPIITEEFILVTDVAINRIDKERGTHYTIQLHFKPHPSDVLTKHKTFKDISDDFIKCYEQTFPKYRDIITKYGFSCSKTK